MLINREKETNGKAVTYLDRLQENYHDLFLSRYKNLSLQKQILS